MTEILEYGFMRSALITGFFTAISTAILGNFVVAARQSIISDMLAHAALVGVGLGIFWNISPTILALITTFISAGLLQRLNQQKTKAPEAYSMLILTGSLAIALLLAHINKDNPISLESYLFGSILTITPTELIGFIILNLAIIITIIFFWTPLKTLVFDAQYLQIQQKNSYYSIIFMLLLGALVGIGLKVIGGLLIGALLVIPVLIVLPFAKSFFQCVCFSIIINIISVNIGIISSFYLDIPTSSAIVLTLIMLFCIQNMVKQA